MFKRGKYAKKANLLLFQLFQIEYFVLFEDLSVPIFTYLITVYFDYSEKNIW